MRESHAAAAVPADGGLLPVRSRQSAERGAAWLPDDRSGALYGGQLPGHREELEGPSQEPRGDSAARVLRLAVRVHRAGRAKRASDESDCHGLEGIYLLRDDSGRSGYAVGSRKDSDPAEGHDGCLGSPGGGRGSPFGPVSVRAPGLCPCGGVGQRAADSNDGHDHAEHSPAVHEEQHVSGVRMRLCNLLSGGGGKAARALCAHRLRVPVCAASDLYAVDLSGRGHHGGGDAVPDPRAAARRRAAQDAGTGGAFRGGLSVPDAGV